MKFKLRRVIDGPPEDATGVPSTSAEGSSASAQGDFVAYPGPVPDTVSPDAASLLAWASELAEQDLVLPEPVRFIEEPLRPISIKDVSEYILRHLRFIAHARFQQRIGGTRRWLPDWWKEREEVALGALAALREALQALEKSKEAADG